MSKKIFVILGHSDNKSLCAGLFEAYVEGAKKTGAHVQEARIGELKFDPVLRDGYNSVQALESDLIAVQNKLKWAEHIVFVYPNWWGSFPAIMKGFFDRTFLPDFAFRYREDSPYWDKLLTGRSAELIVTMDTPPWFYRWVWKRPGHNQMKNTILGFCGIKVTRITEFSPVKNASQAKREEWLQRVKTLAERH